MAEKITKTAVQSKLRKDIQVTKVVKNGSETWAYFKVKGKLGSYNTSGHSLKELVDNIERMSKY